MLLTRTLALIGLAGMARAVPLHYKRSSLHKHDSDVPEADFEGLFSKKKTNSATRDDSERPMPGYRFGYCDGGRTGRRLYWTRWIKKQDVNAREPGNTLSVALFIGMDDNAELRHNLCQLGMNGDCLVEASPGELGPTLCNANFVCQCRGRPEGHGAPYHPEHNPDCENCAVMCRNNAPPSFMSRSRKCGMKSRWKKSTKTCRAEGSPNADNACAHTCAQWWNREAAFAGCAEYDEEGSWPPA